MAKANQQMKSLYVREFNITFNLDFHSSQLLFIFFHRGVIFV